MVPVSVVAPSIIGEVTARPALLLIVPIVTELEDALTSLPVAVAFAVTTEPEAILNPVFVHAPLALLVVVPNEAAPENTSITVPLASVVDPEIDEMAVAVQ